MYDHCSQSLTLKKGKEEECCHKLRTFFIVTNIKRNRSRNHRKALPVTIDELEIITKPVKKTARRNIRRKKTARRNDKNTKTTNGTFDEEEIVIIDDHEGQAINNRKSVDVDCLTREKHFEILLKGLCACSNFDQISALCVQAKEEFARHKIEGKPSEIYIMQDGNCLPRCRSLFAFRSESRHIENRTRIVIELALSEDLYLDNDYLRKGTNSQESLSQLFATYSDFFIPGVHLTDNIVRSIFEAEVLNCPKLGTYMGIWQIFALSNILGWSLMSCYPDKSDNDVPVSKSNGDFPVSQSDDDVPVSQSDDDILVSKSDDVPSDDDILVSKSDDVPVSQSDDIHVSQTYGDVPVSQSDDNLLVSKSDDDIPVSKSDDVPVSQSDDIPVSKSDDVPVSQSDVSVSQLGYSDDYSDVNSQPDDVPVSQTHGDVPVSQSDDVLVSQTHGAVPVSQSNGDLPEI
ncbi:unnamed protein product [Mytilus coruscus]|uniref:Uncharacterized protein n=1 Tax=Mytilus coruscus TaxID=42192 RepID=A0A6J8BSY2_MYTCO|nr:unnamed protein product [Mytilus coruscus]